MKMQLRVTYNDGAGADVTVSAPDLVAFEREFDRSVARFESEVKFTDLVWLAWHRLKRDGKAGDFDTWLDTVDGIEVADVGEPAPLDKTAPTST
jgi:chromosome condensin MukBEF MukE localization factor